METHRPGIRIVRCADVTLDNIQIIDNRGDLASIFAAYCRNLHIKYSYIENYSRIAVDDRELAGCPMHQGQSVTLAIGAANYDPRLHKDPHKFDITREDIDHVAFGGGRRYCLGAPLARLETQIGVLTLLERFPNLRLPAQELTWKTVPGFRGLEKLVVES